MDSVYSINPMQYLEPRLVEETVSRNPEELAQDFESIFLMQLAKQAFNHSFWGSAERIDVKMYQDIFVENFVKELVADDVFGFREIIKKRIEKSQGKHLL
jgi:Rod binding domain-containing protein